MMPGFIIPVIEKHIKTSRHSYDKLMQLFMSMPAPLRASWDIVEIVYPLNIERYVFFLLNKGEVAAGVVDLWQIYYFTVINVHCAFQFNETQAS